MQDLVGKIQPAGYLPLLLALAAILWAPASDAAPIGRPLLQTIEEARTVGPVCAFAESADGELWVGSNVLAHYDGARWDVIDVPGGYAFRGLARLPEARERIYVGGINTVGYVEQAKGAWSYRSLLPELRRAGVEEPGDIWGAYSDGSAIIFLANERVLRWNGSRFAAWPLPCRPHLLGFQTRPEEIWIYQNGTGLFRWGSDGPELRAPERTLPEHPVTWMQRNAKGELLVGLGDGAYRWDGGARFQPIPEISPALRGKAPDSAEALPGGATAIGTYTGGLIVATVGSAAGAIEVKLPDDNICALHRDRAENLWIGSGSGVCRIAGLETTSLFERQNGLPGVPLQVFQEGERTYALTARTLAESDGNSPFRPELQGVWHDAAAAEGVAWAAGFGGIWQESRQGWERVFASPVDVLRILPLAMEDRAGLIFLEAYALKSLSPSPHGGWAAHDLGVRVDDTPISLLRDHGGDVWISTFANGVWRLGPGPAGSFYVRGRYRPGAGMPLNTERPFLVRTGERLFAFTGAEAGGPILRLNAEGNAFEPAPGLAGFAGLAASGEPKEPARYWVVRRRNLPAPAVIRVSRDGTAWEPVEMPGLDEIGSVSEVSTAGDALWVGGSKGLLRMDLSRGDGRSPPLPGNCLETNAEKSGTVSFGFSCPSAVAESSVFYETRLRGAESDWSAPSRESRRTFTHLAHGRYAFEARAVDRWGRTGPPAAEVFTIPAPWYETWPTAIGCLGATALIGFGLARWRMRQLRRQNERLNRLVAERTRELELSNTAKSEFLENISHELRNPLQGLTGLIGRFKEERLDAEERELSRSLKASSQQLVRVFEEVLGFSKLEYGYVSIEKRTFSLPGLLREVCDLFAAQAAEHGCDLKVLAGDGGWFRGDEDKIRTIVANFVGNAVKYAPGAPVEIRSEVEPEEGRDAMVTIEVIDRGPGIPLDEQELIFRKFVRGTEAKRKALPGTGIGLATCQALARILGGTVGLESTPGDGATFFLRIPLEGTQPDPGGGSLARPAFAEDELSRGSALIVEDQNYNRIVLKGIAEDLGYVATAAADAQEAFECLSKGRFDLILLDWELPGMKGGEIAHSIRAEGKSDATQPVIVAVTAHDSDEIRKLCQEAGMDAFLLKPFDAHRLRATIAQAQARRAGTSTRMSGSAAEHPPADEAAQAGINERAFQLYARGVASNTSAAVRAYVEELGREVEALGGGVDSPDSKAVAKAAHRVRSLSGLIGAQALNETATALEALGESEPGRSAKLKIAVAGEFAALKERLADYVRQKG